MTAPTNTGALAFVLPPGWRFVLSTLPEVGDSYTLTPGAGENGVLMFSRWPPPSRPEEIPAIVQKIAVGFAQRAKKSAGYALSSEAYQVEPFAGGECKGHYALFRIEGAGMELVQAVFLMSVGGKIWTGQFTGAPAQWTQALQVLASLKANG